ncbi:hypothetical protein ACFPOU_20885 [Massilia jejuensis]|uniref:Response regulatory domain-containing protein n=1 Tax=Massilia jejuensis TaxID=648894 RepID=A0ABW0PNF3_9BURK
MSTHKKLLAATVTESLEHLRTVYGEHTNLVCVVRLEDALAALDNGVDAVICNVHFDDGALFDLLRTVRAHKTARDIPFIVIDASSTTTSPAITQSIKIASTALGANDVIQISKWIAEMGIGAAVLRTRAIVLGYLGHEPA